MSVHKQLAFPNALRCSAGLDLPFHLVVATQATTPFVCQVEVQNQHPWRRQLAAASRQPILPTMVNASGSPWSLMAGVQRQHTHPYAPSWRRAAQRSTPFALLEKNPVHRRACTPWDLSLGPILLCPQHTLALHAPAGEMELLAAELSCSETDGLWRARLTIARHTDFLALQLGDPVELTIGEEVFALRVVERQVVRNQELAFQIRAASPAVVHDTPLAPLLGRRWESAIRAHDAAQEALDGTSISWSMVDWSIRPGRLEATRSTPWGCARAIALAAGGVLESLADGAIRARPRFPVGVEAWPLAEPDHRFSDSTDHLEVQEHWEESREWKRITVRDLAEEEASRFLDVVLDERPDGLNDGVKKFHAGETAHFLVSAGPGVTPGTPTASAGTLHAEAPQEIRWTEEIPFTGEGRGKLTRPAVRIEEVQWLGEERGTLTLDPDGLHLTAATPGVGVGRVSYLSQVQAYGLQAPTSWSGFRPYPVCVSVRAANPNGDGLRFTVRRSNGMNEAPEVASPLLSDYRALRQRGEMELDASRLARRVEITAVHRSGLQPGQLLEIHDALHGASFRGQLHQVRHLVEKGKALSKLILLAPR